MKLLWGALLPALIILTSPLPVAAVQIGETAPDFIVADVNDGPHIVLSDYRGQVVCLVFFWTG